ncbi:MAG: hypothetical protein BHV68_07470 [Bacteroidales bacterium 43_8]|nr:MAG: hypothetical protein BHV68_07470 [Bacteroidales bacterium 43_8]
MFILLNSEKNEPRSAAAVIGLLGSSLRSPSGLRSDSPRPFSSVFLTTSPTDKGGDFARAFASLFNPPLPLYSFQEHRGRGGLPLLSLLRVFLRPLLIAMLLGSPLYFAAQKHPAMLRDTGEEGEMYFPFASAPIL